MNVFQLRGITFSRDNENADIGRESDAKMLVCLDMDFFRRDSMTLHIYISTCFLTSRLVYIYSITELFFIFTNKSLSFSLILFNIVKIMILPNRAVYVKLE
jgi:hypothetical protein